LQGRSVETALVAVTIRNIDVVEPFLLLTSWLVKVARDRVELLKASFFFNFRFYELTSPQLFMTVCRSFVAAGAAYTTLEICRFFITVHYITSLFVCFSLCLFSLYTVLCFTGLLRWIGKPVVTVYRPLSHFVVN